VGSYSSDLATLFSVPNPCGGNIKNWTSETPAGISRTTDSHSGNYSVILHNWYGYAYATISYHDSISYRPQYFQGYYKYIAEQLNGLEGTADIFLTRFNGASNDTIARGTFVFNSSSSFIPFQSTINYSSALTPDSISIFIINAFPPCDSTSVCNLLYLDDLTLSDTPLQIDESGLDKVEVSVFPNPSTDEFKIITNLNAPLHLILYNSLGDVIMEKTLHGKINSVNVSSLPGGIYFYKISVNRKTIKNGKLIRQ